MGTTIAEFGAGNTPLDMIAYSKGGKNYILMSNTSRGVMKFSAEGLETFSPITKQVPDKAGVPYETIATMTNVAQMDQFDAQRAGLTARGAPLHVQLPLQPLDSQQRIGVLIAGARDRSRLAISHLARPFQPALVEVFVQHRE